jgi:hypothetical protein
VSVNPTTPPKLIDDRKPEFTLVLGPSGSGKTVFALRRLPALLFEGTVETCYRLLFPAVEVTYLMSTTGLSFPDAVASLVQAKIATELSPFGLTNVKEIDLNLHVTIDEAGVESFKDYFDTKAKIVQIVNAVKTKMRYKFTKEVHITLAGSGLEVTTANISTMVEATKYKMQPWTIKNFEAMVDASHHTNKGLIKSVVQDYPILEDLASNARCGFFLFRSMLDERFLGKNRKKSFAKVLVSVAADRYCDNNSLQSVRSAEDRLALFRVVFKELDNATRQPDVAFVPTFEGLTTELLRVTANSLLDKHFELIDGLPTLVPGNRYALSISPALAIVMANLLLNAEADITWDWQSLKSMVMLSELKQMIVTSQNVPPSQDRFVVSLRNPLPDSNVSFSVPVVGNGTVILNGPMATYADVIAPYRLVQVKFSIDDMSTKDLFLEDELSKMGLLRSKKNLLQQYMTRILYNMWEGSGDTPPAVVNTKVHGMIKKYRFTCYPFSTLNARQTFEELEMVDGKLEKDRLVVTGDIPYPNLDSVFSANRPVTAVFATNCKEFELKPSSIIINPNDVDWEGKL